jgi:hypothetical protein
MNKETTKKNQKTGKVKKLVPSDVQSKRRQKKLEKNKKSAQKSRLKKKEEQANKEITIQNIEYKNKELKEKIKALKSLKERLEIFEIFLTCDRIGTTESDPGRMQSGDTILEVEDDHGSFQTPIPNFIFQGNDDYIEATSSIEYPYFSMHGILIILNF